MLILHTNGRRVALFAALLASTALLAWRESREESFTIELATPAVDVSAVDHHLIVFSKPYTTTEDLFIEKAAEGRLSPGLPLEFFHHARIQRADGADPNCAYVEDTLEPRREALFLFGQENADGAQSVSEYGVLVRRGEQIELRAEWHRVPGDKLYEDVSFSARLKARPFREADRSRLVRTLVLGTEGCGVKNRFAVPPRTVGYERRKQAGPYAFPEDEEIVAMAAHFHPREGGREAVATLNGEPRWRFQSVESAIAPDAANPFGVKVNEGDQLDFLVRYDNTREAPEINGMGTLIITLRGSR